MSDGGGSSGGGGNVTGTTTQMTDLPEWARGYAKSALEKTQALTDKPYEAYGGERIAGFSPMQLQAQQAAGKMTTSPLTGQAADISSQIAQQGMGTQTFGQPQAEQYMSPYMQSVVDIQKREAGRQSGIQGTQQAGQAAQAGALGGSRDAIMRAERERNLGQQMGDIQAQGSQNAFQQAQQQFNADQARKMQGLGIAGGAAGQLGQLGYQNVQQGMDINRLQSAYGGQEQALRQQGLTQGYQDFQNQQQYPYKQLGFMSDMIRGLPVGSQTSSMTSAPGASGASQLGGLGAIGMGLSKYFAEGGHVRASGLADLALARMKGHV